MQRHRTRGGRVATAVAVAALLVLAWPRPAPAQAPPASELLIYAASYVADFVVRFANVVAEERYEQWFVNGLQQRELVSDFLIVQLPSSNDWASFRDVFEVDGEPVGNRQERLLSLLLDGSSTSTLERARAHLPGRCAVQPGRPGRPERPPAGAGVPPARVQRPLHVGSRGGRV